MKAEIWIRRVPASFVGVAAADFAKQLAGIYYSLQEYRNVDLSLMAADARLQIQTGEFERVMDAVIYPAGWLAYAAFAVILLAIYDRLKVGDA